MSTKIKLGTALKSETGFSLIEIMTVMIIITILVGIAVAVYSDVTKKPANEAHNANVRILISAMHMALSDHGADAFKEENDEDNNPVWYKNSYDNNADDKPCWKDYLQEWPTVPPESDHKGNYEVYLDYPGPSVRVEVNNGD